MAVTIDGIFFTNWSEAELLQLIANVKRDLIAGRVVMNYTIGGKTVGKEWALSPEKLLAEARAALEKLDPVGYGRVTRTVARFH